MSKQMIISLMIFVFLLSGKITIANNNSPEHEYWQEFYVFRNFGEKIEGEILFNNLYNNNLGHYDKFIEGKITYNTTKCIYMELMYRHEYYDLDGKMVKEYRPMFRLSGKNKIGNWNLRNRHRIEYRMFEVGGEHFRYRTDLKISPDLGWTSLNINPYIIEEIFISKGMMSRNRVYAGIEGKKGRFEPALYFLVQSNNEISKWSSRNIFGVVLGIEI